MPNDTLFALRDATLRIRDRWILKNTSWSIARGEHWAVIGPNGSGKTTLLNAIAGVVPVVAGTVFRADGLRVGIVGPEYHRKYLQTDARREITWSPVSSSYPVTTVRNVIEHDDADPELADHLATGLHVSSLLDRGVRTLSTGEMKKVLLVAATASRPDLLLLDEPFDGLDAGSRGWFADLLAEAANHSMTLVLATHREDEIVESITRYVALDDGCIVHAGDVRDEAYYQLSAVRTTSIRDGDPTGEFDTISPAGEPMIELRNVSVSYNGNRVLDGLSWVVRRGENWSVTGPNGSGKTTLLDLVWGNNLQAYANDITLFGRRRGSGESIWDIKRNIGFVTPHLQAQYDASITAREVILSGFFDSIGLYRRHTADQEDRYHELAGRLCILHLGETRFDRLSSGERTLVLIARAAVKVPKLLMLDEPCQGLDPERRNQIIAAVDTIGSEPVTDIIYVTHRADELPTCITHSLDLSVGT